MIATREHYPRFTPEEYFAWEEQQNLKHEYLHGKVYAMSDGMVNHGRVSKFYRQVRKPVTKARNSNSIDVLRFYMSMY